MKICPMKNASDQMVVKLFVKTFGIVPREKNNKQGKKEPKSNGIFLSKPEVMRICNQWQEKPVEITN